MSGVSEQTVTQQCLRTWWRNAGWICVWACGCDRSALG
jgi:hypothetical protein